MLAVDCETKDPELRERGPGFMRGDAHIVGLAVGTEDGGRWYFPMRHEVGGMNMDAEQVLRWARDELTRDGQTKVGANLLYDLEALAAEGVHVRGPTVDVQWQEALIDENAKTYALEALAQKYLGEGKHSTALYDWCAAAYGGKANGSQRGNIYRAPASLVGPYAEGDVDLPLRIAEAQREVLDRDGLLGLAGIENRLLPILLAMRRRGVRVDLDAAARLDERLGLELHELQSRYDGLSVWSAETIAAHCRKHGFAFPLTPAGAPSFTAKWLKAQEHQFFADVLKLRAIDKARGTFVQSYVLKHVVRGRIHAQFHPAKGDEYGTVSGRFSSSNPNLQNIPSRDDSMAPLIRGLYLPEPGEDWVRFDWSQIEYRLLVHYGRGEGAAGARAKYRSDPTTDFHAMVNEWVFGGDPSMRKPAKNINFGLVYGMGVPTMAANLGRTKEATLELFKKYHEALPFVKETFDEAARMAMVRGYTRTLLGRRSRFELWEPRDKKRVREGSPSMLTREAAEKEWGAAIRRALSHKALNRMLQGGAADIMKKAMVDIWESGVCDVLGAPLLTVHDELDWSAPRTNKAREALSEAHRIMEHCVKLRVPLLAEREDGENWGNLK